MNETNTHHISLPMASIVRLINALGTPEILNSPGAIVTSGRLQAALQDRFSDLEGEKLEASTEYSLEVTDRERDTVRTILRHLVDKKRLAGRWDAVLIEAFSLTE